MKNNFPWMCFKPPVVCLWVVTISLFILTDGSLGAGNAVSTESKEFDSARDSEASIVVSSVILPKVIGNNNAKLETLNFECEVSDKECEKDKIGFESIRSLHLMIDDDHNGNVDLSESDEISNAAGKWTISVQTNPEVAVRNEILQQEMFKQAGASRHFYWGFGLHGSQQFLRDELQYTDGFDRQELFHNNDKLISVDDLWKAWKHSAVYNWTVDDVIQWLVEDVDLPQYSQTFHNFAIDGSVLPRLVNSTSPLLVTLGIRNPVHKQKLSLKAMDTVLFGAPKRLHNYAKDVMLFMAILLAIGISWFACLHHRYSQSQVKKMMKDLEALQKAEDALKKLSNELADAEKTQVSMPAEKQEELRMLRQNSLRLKVPHLNIGDKSPTRHNRDNSSNRRQEGDMKLQRAEEELANLREALSEAENRLEIQQHLESQWSVPGELQAWLQLTHELEQMHFNAKRQAAERQLLAARDGCEKIKKRKQSFLGPLRMAHSNSLDDIDQSILDARAALEEVKQDLQERLHRWHTIEILCGFPILNNPGLTTLKQALGRDTGNGSRMQNSLMAGIPFEETDEDMAPTDEEGDSDSVYNQIPDKPRQQIFAWAHRSRHSYWTKKKTLNDSRESESVYNQIPERPRQQIFAWAHRSRLNNWMKKKSTTNGFATSATLPSKNKSSAFLKEQATGSLQHASKASSASMPSASSLKNGSREAEPQGATTGSASTTAASGPRNSVIFQLGDGSHHERSHSSASLSLANPNIANSNHHGHAQAPAGVTQVHPAAPSTHPSGLRISSSSGNLMTNHTMNRTGSLTLKMFTSASGNHLSARAAVPQSSSGTASTANASADSPQEKLQQNNAGQAEQGSNASVDSGQTAAPAAGSDCSNVLMKTNQLEDSDSASLGSTPSSQSNVILSRGQHEHSPELDQSSQDTDSLHDSKDGEAEIVVSVKKNGKKKTLLPKFLQKSKGKQKTA